MNTSLGKKLVVLFVTFLLALSPWSGVLAEEYSAQTMRLLRYDGDIVIEDANGKPRFVMENVRFKSGEAVVTGENKWKVLAIPRFSPESLSADAAEFSAAIRVEVLSLLQAGLRICL